MQQLALPILPTVRHFTVLTSYRPHLAQYASAGVGPAPSYRNKPYPACSFPIYLLQSIEAMPRLESIMLAYEEQPCPSIQTAEHLEPDFFVPSIAWEEGGQRGLVIRRYRDPLHPQRTFVHVRSLTRVVDAHTCPTYMSFQRFWCDYAAYCGEMVDASLLKRVYAAAGLEKDWKTGNRDLELSEAGWEVLRSEIQVEDVLPIGELMVTTDSDGAEGVEEWVVKDCYGTGTNF